MMRFTYWMSLANVGLVCVALSACSADEGDGNEQNTSGGAGSGGSSAKGQGGSSNSSGGTQQVTTGGTSSNGGSGASASGGGGNQCTLPKPPLACKQTRDCGNYPETVCGQTGFCVCGGGNSGGSAGASGSGGGGGQCTAPETPLVCKYRQDCGNYPDTICGQTGFCVCP